MLELKISNCDNIQLLKDSLGELYTPEELASYFKVTPVSIYTWVKAKKIDCFILTKGKRKTTVRFNQEHVQRFIQSRNLKQK